VKVKIIFASGIDIVVCCLKARISEAEQTSIASQRFDNTQIRGNE
jgi:hypothetical protein